MAGFIEVIKLIQDGELVSAAITNRPTQQNDQNIRYVRDLFTAAMLGETIFARNRTIEKDAKVGQAVFYNPVTQQYERGLAGVEVAADGSLNTTVASQIWGVIYRKLNDTKADILLHGVADINLAEAIDGDPEPGKIYYLSSASKGKLVLLRPAVGITVLQVAGANANGTHNVYVNTKFHDLLEAHRHYSFTLVSEPAGSVVPPTVGERHQITTPDPDVEGWLPADHASFGGKAPAGAAFGYNIAVSKLYHVWPPLPVEGAYLEWNKGEDKEMLGMGVPIGPSQLCVIDRNGIWWMSDCYDDVPWRTSLTHNVSTSDSTSQGSVSIECPRELTPVMKLWFTKPVFQTTGSCVLSLTAAENSGLTVVCIDTLDPAKTGHLLIDLDLSLVIVADNQAGHLVFKSLDDRGRIRRGPVVESLKAGSSNVSLTSNVPAVAEKYYGNVVIDVDLELDGREIAVDTVHLDGAEEEFYEETIALGFRAGVRASFRGRLNVPVGLSLPTGTKLKLRFWFLNRSTLDVPAELFSFSYRRLATPSALVTPTSLPTSVDEVNLAAIPAADVAVSSTANQYFTVETAEFEIATGDTVHFTLERAGDEDDFSGNLQLLRQRGIYVTPTT
jgi:hypothetical protein